MIHLLAQAAASSFDVTGLISSVGFPIFAFLAVGWYVATGRYHGESELSSLKASIAAGEAREAVAAAEAAKREERLEAQRDALIENYNTVVTPTISAAIQTFGQIAQVTEKSVVSVTKIEQTVAALVAALDLAQKVREAGNREAPSGEVGPSRKRRRL